MSMSRALKVKVHGLVSEFGIWEDFLFCCFSAMNLLDMYGEVEGKFPRSSSITVSEIKIRKLYQLYLRYLL
jgi:hypothetical protein